jgi:hypothetical protein
MAVFGAKIGRIEKRNGAAAYRMKAGFAGDFSAFPGPFCALRRCTM